MITVTYATFIELPSFYSPRILGEPVRVERVDPVLRRSTSRYVPPSTRDPTAELEVILRPETDGHLAVAVLCLVGLEVTQPFPEICLDRRDSQRNGYPPMPGLTVTLIPVGRNSYPT